MDGSSQSEIYSYFIVKIFICQNITEKQFCKNPIDIEKFFKENIFQFIIQDIELTSENYYSWLRTISGPIFKDLYNKIYAY